MVAELRELRIERIEHVDIEPVEPVLDAAYDAGAVAKAGEPVGKELGEDPKDDARPVVEEDRIEINEDSPAIETPRQERVPSVVEKQADKPGDEPAAAPDAPEQSQQHESEAEDRVEGSSGVDSIVVAGGDLATRKTVSPEVTEPRREERTAQEIEPEAAAAGSPPSGEDGEGGNGGGGDGDENRGDEPEDDDSHDEEPTKDDEGEKERAPSMAGRKRDDGVVIGEPGKPSKTRDGRPIKDVQLPDDPTDTAERAVDPDTATDILSHQINLQKRRLQINL